ncbi:MAG: hypothetical protein ACI4C1_03725 [Lachnospiraceae bacterium]
MRKIGTMSRLCFIVLSLLFVLTGCRKPVFVSNTTEPEMQISLENGKKVYNGTEQGFCQVERGQTGELQISVHAESGSLNIYVFPIDDPEHFYYRGRDIPTSDFLVRLSEIGEYKVWVEADRFVGSYEFEWRIY